VIHAHVRFHEHKEKLRGHAADPGPNPAANEPRPTRRLRGRYGANHAFHVALDKLERNVLERKGVNADAKQRGQLLQNLEL